MERIKIAVVGPGWPLRGGIAQYSTKLVAELAGWHDVRHVSYARQYPGLLFPGKTQVDESPRPAGCIAAPALDSLNPVTWVRTADELAGAGVGHAVLMWWHPFFAPCLGTLARRLAKRGVRSTFLCHNVAPHEGSRFNRVLSRWAFAPAASFVVHARELTASLADLAPPGARVAVSPHPLYDQYGTPPPRQEARLALGLPAAGPVLLFFGLIRAYKGVFTAIEALRELPEATLVIAGECYEPEGPYRARIAELGLTGRVRFENRFIPNHEVAPYFAAADVVTLPYHNASASGVIPIAYAMGRPVVATAVGGLPEAVIEDETGHLVPPRDAGALAAAIRTCLARDPATYAPGLEKARRRLSWATMRETLESLI